MGVRGPGPHLAANSGVSAMIMTFHLTGRYIEESAKGRASMLVAVERLFPNTF